MVATRDAVYSVLGLQDALLAAETRLWRELENTRCEARERASSEAKHAGKEGLAGILMAPRPSRWAAGAMMSRSPVGARRNIGPEVDRRAAAASDKATRLDEMKHSTSAACCHIT